MVGNQANAVLGSINNACANCGWFSARWHDWVPWDGRLPEAVRGDVEVAPVLTPLKCANGHLGSWRGDNLNRHCLKARNIVRCLTVDVNLYWRTELLPTPVPDPVEAMDIGYCTHGEFIIRQGYLVLSFIRLRLFLTSFLGECIFSHWSCCGSLIEDSAAPPGSPATLPSISRPFGEKDI